MIIRGIIPSKCMSVRSVGLKWSSICIELVEMMGICHYLASRGVARVHRMLDDDVSTVGRPSTRSSRKQEKVS